MGEAGKKDGDVSSPTGGQEGGGSGVGVHTKTKEKEVANETAEEEEEEEEEEEDSWCSSASSYEGIMEDAHSIDRCQIRRLHRELVWLQAALQLPLPRPWAARYQEEQRALLALRKLVDPLAVCRLRLIAAVRIHQREAVAVSLIAAQDKEQHAEQHQIVLSKTLEELEKSEQERRRVRRRAEEEFNMLLTDVECQRAPAREAAAMLSLVKQKRKMI